MSGKAALDKKLEALAALRTVSSESAEPALRKALTNFNGFYVSKAAAIVPTLQLTSLIPDLIRAFHRFLQDPVKTDPQCWAKIAIAKALHDFEYNQPELFLVGLKHVQMEPVYGGFADSAGLLRGECALALINATLTDFEILTHLMPGLTDPIKPVRVDTAAAIAALGAEAGSLLLRLKALTGDKEPEVIGQCLTGILELAPPDALAFIETFLRSKNEDLQIEAIGALAPSKNPEAFTLLKTIWKEKLPQFARRALLLGLAASPIEDSATFLREVIKKESGELAQWASEALNSSRFRDAM
jgi:hypothetical protein